MASERQIAANRHNARKSTGPRSGAGKKRASNNAYRHGLSVRRTFDEAFADEVDQLARKIAGNTDSAITLACARTAAEAELDLAGIRQTRIALIDLGQLIPRQEKLSPRAVVGRLRAELKRFEMTSDVWDPEPITPQTRSHHKSPSDPPKPCAALSPSW